MLTNVAAQVVQKLDGEVGVEGVDDALDVLVLNIELEGEEGLERGRAGALHLDTGATHAQG